MVIMKVPTVRRNLGTDEQFNRSLGAKAPQASTSTISGWAKTIELLYRCKINLTFT